MLIPANPSRTRNPPKPQAAWSFVINEACLSAFDHAFSDLTMRDRWNFALALGMAFVDPGYSRDAQGVAARDVMPKARLAVLYGSDAETIYSQLVEASPSYKTNKLKTRPVRVDPSLMSDFRTAVDVERRNIDLHFALCNATAAAVAHRIKTGRALRIETSEGFFGVTPDLIQAITASRSVTARSVALIAARLTSAVLEAFKPGLSTLVAMGASSSEHLAAFIEEPSNICGGALALPALDF